MPIQNIEREENTKQDSIKPIVPANNSLFGVVGMASVNVRDGFVKLLKKDNLRHGVNVSVADGKLMIELHIIVAYEVSILAVAQNLVDNVKYKVEEYTGMEVGKITVCVEGVRVIN